MNRIEDMKKLYLIIALLVCVPIVTDSAQSYKKTESGIKNTINSIEVEIQFYNPSTVRVLKSELDFETLVNIIQ
jgi:alpha-D-xyloside xylohydrolase